MRALVTGGGGFLGRAIVTRLVDEGWRVRTLQRGAYPELDALGAESVRGDISDPDSVDRAVEGCDVVFHAAALVRMWGDYGDFHRVNVIGTENILTCMKRHDVPKLVYTSTPSVVHAGHSIEGGDESLPYPDEFESPYTRSKAAAEASVLAANGSKLATVAIRPHLIWGPGDTNLVPQIVARARSGRLRFVGDGSNLVDTVYIDNAVDAHLAARDRLEVGAECAGKAFFISNGDPRPLRDIVNGIVIAAGLEPVDRTVSLPVALAVGRVFEVAHKALGRDGEPLMTRFIARNLATAHWYDISAARRLLGYEPRISIEQGFERLRQWFDEQENRQST
jgi:nucleoside-diphosphate-sugar epimerase